MTARWILAALAATTALTLTGCGEQPKVKIVKVEMISNDAGSPDFKRMIKVCFDRPLEGAYHHEIRFESTDGFELEGKGTFRAAASDPDNPCILRNMNQYVTKDSPPRARDLIERYLGKGQVASVSITVWGDENGHKGLQMDKKTFNNL